MISMSSSEVQQNFAEFLEKARRQTIVIKDQNREIGAFVPMSDYNKLRELRMNELQSAVRALSDEAKANGLTEKIAQ